MKRINILLLMALVLLALTGCGEVEITENKTKTINLNEEKESASVDTQKEADSVEREGLTGESLPEGFPPEIPLPEGEVIDAWPSLYDNDIKGFDITMVPVIDYLGVKDFYEAAFEEITEEEVNERTKDVSMKGVIGDYEIEVLASVGDEEYGTSLMLFIKEIK